MFSMSISSRKRQTYHIQCGLSGWKEGFHYIKRFNITSITRDREYDVTQGTPGSRIVYFTANPNGEAEVIKITLKPNPRIKKSYMKRFQ